MKRAGLCLFLLGFLATGQAQKVIQLEEAKVELVPEVVMEQSNNNSFVFKIKENYEGEFTNDPLRFVITKFDIKGFVHSVKKEKFDSYEVTFKSRKGGLIADYDKNGELVRTFQKFKDVVLPSSMRKQLVTDYKGWSMTGNTYTAKGKKNKINKEVYRISLKKDNQSQKIKFSPQKQAVASTLK